MLANDHPLQPCCLHLQWPRPLVMFFFLFRCTMRCWGFCHSSLWFCICAMSFYFPFVSLSMFFAIKYWRHMWLALWIGHVIIHICCKEVQTVAQLDLVPDDSVCLTSFYWHWLPILKNGSYWLLWICFLGT